MQQPEFDYDDEVEELQTNQKHSCHFNLKKHKGLMDFVSLTPHDVLKERKAILEYVIKNLGTTIVKLL